jgi:hypothetical protein
MSQILDASAMNAALKELYDNQTVENLVYNDNPFLAMVRKNTDFGGKYKPVPIITGASQSRSSSFSNAQSNQSPVQIESFFLTRASDYSIAQIDNQTMLASRTDKMSFLEGSKVLIDGAITSITLSLSSSLFRSGTGSIGQIQSIAAGDVVLTDPNDIVQFEVNMVLQAAATDGGTPRAALGYVVSVDRSAGTMQISTSYGGAPASPALWVANDFMLVQGDSNAKIKGLLAWIPAVAPSSSDNFFGVNRSVDSTRLAGVRYNGSSQPIEEALIDASSLLAREGGKPDVCIMSYASYSALEKSLGAKVQYIDLKGPAEIAFRGIEINGANSRIKCFPDRSCPSRTAFLLTMKSWCLESLGDAPQILKYGDGLEMLRVYNADAGEVRIAYYANLSCNAPGHNSYVSLQA